MLQHVGLEAMDSDRAARFFTGILGLPKTKTATLDPPLNKALFGQDGPVEMAVFGNDEMSVEVFISGRPVTPSYQHICITVADRETFVEKCRASDLPVITAQKGDRELLFIRDFSGNLYEIKASD